MGLLLLIAAHCAPITGCVIADTQAPAPAISYGFAGGAASAGMHTVIGHETLWSIAQNYRLSMQDIIRINDLKPPYGLAPEQRIKLPAPREYRAKANDTLYGISRMFDVSVTELARLNALREPYAVTAGQALRLPPPPLPKPPPALPPAQTEFSLATAANPTHGPVPRYAPLPPREKARGRPASDGVWRDRPPAARRDVSGQGPAVAAQSSGTVERQALAQPATARSAVQGNGIQAETLAAPPQQAWAGQGQAPAVSPASPAAAVATTWTPLPAEVAQAVPVLAPDTPPRSGPLFGWPVGGPVISTYGTKAGGLHNDGINIQAPRGAPVKAAENGIVVYADDQLKGFGNLVLVRHADRWMTAYAHMDTIAVQRGQTVRRGDRLGTVGDTGGAAGPQLHFELRHGTQALNPEAFLERQGT